VKPLTFSILRLLSADTFQSGEHLARRLGISRAGVWQALAALEETGIPLQRVRGRGYRLPRPVQWLAAESIRHALGEKSSGLALEIHDHLPSTNTLLMQKAQQGAPHSTCIVAEIQGAGRGRRGREWHSPLGGGLTFSLLWRFNQGAAALSGLSLAVGVALVRALRAEGLEEIALKWPNDILHRQRKLAGILIELQGDVLGPSTAVIGIGMNLDLPESIRGQIDQPVTDFATAANAPYDRNRLLGRILAHLIELLQQFEAQGFTALKEEWLRHHAYQGQPVKLLLPNGGRQEGVTVGVDEDGALLVDTGHGPVRFSSGEVSLRGAR
jgi:BirA family biotin operon repressor/biotin-[acetyl-CoA-carboxylase] ligase